MAYVWDKENKDTYNNRYGAYKYKLQHEFIVQNFTHRSNILDIAGGSGRFALPLYDLCKNITVVDISEEALALLASRNREIKRTHGDFMKLDFDSTYTFILCIEAISYFNYNDFFKKISTLLDDKGSFVFMMVNPESWRFKLRNFNMDRTNYNEIKLAEMKAIIERNNLIIDTVQGFNWIPLPLSYSNSPLIELFAYFEKMAGLNKLYSQSPWLMVSVKKQGR
jgi:SAM-dependent methyltransferase